MQWIRSLFRKAPVIDIPKDPKDQLAYLIEHLNKITIPTTVVGMDNIVLNLYRTRADRFLATTHDCLHIIRSRLYFTDALKMSLIKLEEVELYDYVTNKEGFYYDNQSFFKELIEKLSNIHYLLDDPVYNELRGYYLRQLEPILHDVGILLETFK